MKYLWLTLIPLLLTSPVQGQAFVTQDTTTARGHYLGRQIDVRDIAMAYRDVWGTSWGEVVEGVTIHYAGSEDAVIGARMRESRMFRDWGDLDRFILRASSALSQVGKSFSQHFLSTCAFTGSERLERVFIGRPWIMWAWGEPVILPVEVTPRRERAYIFVNHRGDGPDWRGFTSCDSPRWMRWKIVGLRAFLSRFLGGVVRWPVVLEDLR